MKYLQIDDEKCVRCDACVSVCSARIINRAGDNAPAVHSTAVALCLGCGHCVAVCPSEALRLASQPAYDFEDIPAQPNFDVEAVDNFLRGRRSVRAFKKEPVPRELLEYVVVSTAYAPTAVNRQPVQWIMVYEADMIHRLLEMTVAWMRSNTGDLARYRGMIKQWEKGEDAILRGAPHLAIAWTASNATPWALVDSCIALTYFEIFARLNGLGTCWAGLFTRAAQHSPEILNVLGLPADASLHGAQMVGFPNISFPRLPWRKNPPLEWR